MLLKAGIALNGVVGLALAVPIVALSASAPWRSKDASYNSWVSLGALTLSQWAKRAWRTTGIPSARPWDGETDNMAC